MVILSGWGVIVLNILAMSWSWDQSVFMYSRDVGERGREIVKRHIIGVGTDGRCVWLFGFVILKSASGIFCPDACQWWDRFHEVDLPTSVKSGSMFLPMYPFVSKRMSQSFWSTSQYSSKTGNVLQVHATAFYFETPTVQNCTNLDNTHSIDTDRYSTKTKSNRDQQLL